MERIQRLCREIAGIGGDEIRQRVRLIEDELALQAVEREREVSALAASLSNAETEIAARDEEIERLRGIIAKLQHMKFGAQSEKSSGFTDAATGQPFIDDEDQENEPPASESNDDGDGAEEDEEETEEPKRVRRRGGRGRQMKKIPAHIERIVQVIEPTTTQCNCGCEGLYRTAPIVRLPQPVRA